MIAYSERVRRAEALGWRVIEKEVYNPGGTINRTVLVDPTGAERGYVDKCILAMVSEPSVVMLIPDPDAAAWALLDE